jgi:hypothetical protein
LGRLTPPTRCPLGASAIASRARVGRSMPRR